VGGPAAVAARGLGERAALRAFDRGLRDGCRVADAGCLRIDEVQQTALGKRPRAPVAWRALARRSARGPPRREAEAVDLADDGVAGDADLVGDLAAGQSRIDIASKLLDPLLRPGCDHNDVAP